MSNKDEIKDENEKVLMTDDNTKNTKYIDLMKKNYTYPDPSDDNFQSKIYKKREFNYYRLPGRPNMASYEDIREYRDNICNRRFALHEHQSFLSNFINPDTPYRGLLVFHGTGTGKCLEGNQRVMINGDYIKIKEVYNRYSDLTTKTIDNDGGEWYLPNEELTTVSLDKDYGHNIDGKIVRIYRKKVNEQLRKITLSQGKSIIITQMHPLLTHSSWSNKLTEGIFVGVPNEAIKGYTKFLHGVLYDYIINIEMIEHNDYVYDVEVETHHNYIAEGIYCHNTCAGIAIAEKFKDMVIKYNTKIHVLVNGPLIRKNWLDELLKCTGETYLKHQDKSLLLDDAERTRAKKTAIMNALQYYKFMSYRSFYRKVLGEKIADRRAESVNNDEKTDKVKISYRKTEEGEFERDIAVDRIHNLNNSIIMVDEAHNLTGNAYGEALQKIINNSTNLRVILFTATPMKNLADDIIELLNYIRPPDDQIQRDKLFNSYKNHMMDFKPGGLEYLKKMSRGYISYLRGADPVTFAKRIEMGEKPNGLLFTKIIPCRMLEFQQITYDVAAREEEDQLDRSSEAVSNFAFPGLTDDRKDIIGYYGTEALNIIIGQLKTQSELLNKKIIEKFPDIDPDIDGQPLMIADSKKNVTGSIMKMKHLKKFSIKFWTAINNINKLFEGKSDVGSRTAFVYSNLVKVGIELFKEILIQNGWLEYDETGNYNIKPDTICYFTGRPYRDYVEAKAKKEPLMDDNGNPYTDHKFYPATFMTVTGSSSEENMENIPEEKKMILDNVFNNVENIHGKYIKLVLGSKVMNEGISLKNVAETHILDVHFTLGKVDQVIGRAIRWCSHYQMMSDEYKFPEVKVYKYAIVLENGLSSELDLYRKAEKKYILIKKVERVIKRNAIDCALNRPGNIFREEVEKYKDCVDPVNLKHEEFDEEKVCPALCDYAKCDFDCDDDVLNAEYYDRSKNMYKKIAKNKLDTTTFTNSLARGEIEFAKLKIKEMFKTKEVYKLIDILNYVKANHSEDKIDMFDEFFVYKALDELIPVSENDFNNFRDTVFNKFNQSGYLRYVGDYYIFQPFNQNEDVPMYYRSNYEIDKVHKLNLSGYLENTTKFKNLDKQSSSDKKKTIEIEDDVPIYTFDLEYYDARKEFKYVGIVDKEVNRKKNKRADEMDDVFKIREERAKILDKKRGTGIPSLKGAVCATSKQKEYLENIAKKVGLSVNNKEETRQDLCNRIREKFIELEKYSTGKDKITYVMIPKDHPSIPFPLNLEDRIDYIKSKIKEKIRFSFNFDIKSEKGKDKKDIKFIININHDKKMDEFKDLLTNLGGKLDKNKWTFIID
jgi:DNA polymerase III delta prime subunit